MLLNISKSDEIINKKIREKEYQHQWYLRNRQRKLQQTKEWRKLYPTKNTEYHRNYYHKHQEKLNAYLRQNREKHKDIVNTHRRERYKNDNIFREKLLNSSREFLQEHKYEVNKRYREKYNGDVNYKMERRKNQNTNYYKRREKVRQEVFIRLGGKCKICGETETVCFDCHHINGENSRHKLGITDNLKRWKLYLSQIDSIVLLCSNCHRKFHANILNEEEKQLLIKN